MHVRILLTLALAAVLSLTLSVLAYRAGAGFVGAFMVYAFGGSVLTVIIAAVQVVLEPVFLPGGGDAELARGDPAMSAAERA